MKKILTLGIVLLVLGGGYLAAAHLSGGAFPTLGLKLGGDRGILRRISTAFLEDVQFKDFKRAASYHAPALQASVDIPFLLQRLFQLKPEQLDIMHHEIMFAEVDSTGLRGRVKTRIKAKELVRGDIRQQELMLYYERAAPGAPWYMKLEDSLRNLEADKGKRS
jgi:hypothetical protein